MSSPATSRAETLRNRESRIHTHTISARKAAIIIAAAVLFFSAMAVLYVKIWPFSQQSVVQDLGETSGTDVTVERYRPTYFPPGCILEGVEFHHGHDRFKLITIQKLIIEGSYTGILRRHVPRITAIGAHVFVPAFGSGTTFQTEHSKTVVDQIVANGSVVEFESKEKNKEPVHFDVQEASFYRVRWGSPIGYHLKFHNPSPPGEILVNGKFGPWAHGQPQITPMSGEYNFDHADLSVYGGIAGILTSKGNFEGVLHHLNVSGNTSVPNFEVQSGGHKVNLQTKFEAFVDGMNGDTFLKRVEAHFERTTVIAQGSVARVPGYKGKFTKVQFTARRSRIEDMLGLFVTERPAMAGEASLQATAEFPPDEGPFLEKLKLNGVFGIDEGNFTKAETQKDVDQLSAGARGQKKEDPETVLSDLKGQVLLTGGIAHFSDLSFSIPGAKAHMHGTYSLADPYRINLHGKMWVDTQISKTTSGMKSFLLKIMDPLFKKKKKGEVVPVHILGTYKKPQFGLDLTNNQDSKP